MKKLIVSSIQQNSKPFVLLTAGGGVQCISELLSFGGGSRCFIKGSALWDRRAFASEVEVNPDKYESMGFVCPKTSVFMALSAYKQAKECRPDEEVMGIGVTCCLTYENERVGRQHKVYVTKMEKDRVFTAGFIFRPPSRNRFLWPSERAYQESTISDFVLSVIAAHDERCIEDFKHHADLSTLEVHDTHDKYGVMPLFLGEEHLWMNNPDDFDKVDLLFPGSFNPPHAGHFSIVKHAEKVTGSNCYYEISIQNVYKAPITIHEINDRLEVFERLGLLNRVILTTCAKYVDKFIAVGPAAKKNKVDSVTIVAGYDAFKYLIDSLEDSRLSEELYNQLSFPAVPEQRFLVFNRNVGGKNYDPHELLALDFSKSEHLVSLLRERTTVVDSSKFAMDISSSKIREQNNGQ